MICQHLRCGDGLDMGLLTDALRKQLLNNGAVPDGCDHKPVVKFFTPDAAATWLITEMSPAIPIVCSGSVIWGWAFRGNWRHQMA